LGGERKATYHTFTKGGMFLCKRGRPGNYNAIAFLSTVVEEPNENDRSKLVRVMNFLRVTVDEVLILEADITQMNAADDSACLEYFCSSIQLSL